MYLVLRSQCKEIVPDNLLVLEWRLNVLSCRTVGEIVPVHKQLGHVIVVILLELRSRLLRNQLKVKKP